jgi:hypothetical protein
MSEPGHRLVSRDVEYCDDCGEMVFNGRVDLRYVVTALPANVASANVGESATLCKDCWDNLPSCEGCGGRDFRLLSNEDKAWVTGEEEILICTKCGEEFFPGKEAE